MKAMMLREIGSSENLSCEEVETPVPGKKEVLIQLKYAAINRRDAFIPQGLYPGIQLPSILGSDGAGVAVGIGDEVTSVKKGSEVIVNPSYNWGDSEKYSGEKYVILGMPIDGTYAQYVCVPENQVFEKPKHLSFEEAAALPLAALTAYRALFTRGNVQEGETVLIPGIGSGVALFVLQMAVAAGAKVYVTSSSDEKISRAKQLGAADGMNYKIDKWSKEFKKVIGGADLIIDGVGGPDFNSLIDLANPGGRIVSYGATNGPVPNLVMPRVFFKNLDIKGTTMGSSKDFQRMLDFYSEHKLHPVIDRCFPLEKAAEAHNYMNEGNNFGKITLEIPS